MPTTGKLILDAAGRVMLDADGKRVLANASDLCPECGCTPCVGCEECANMITSAWGTSLPAKIKVTFASSPTTCGEVDFFLNGCDNSSTGSEEITGTLTGDVCLCRAPDGSGLIQRISYWQYWKTSGGPLTFTFDNGRGPVVVDGLRVTIIYPDICGDVPIGAGVSYAYIQVEVLGDGAASVVFFAAFPAGNDPPRLRRAHVRQRTDRVRRLLRHLDLRDHGPPVRAHDRRQRDDPGVRLHRRLHRRRRQPPLRVGLRSSPTTATANEFGPITRVGPRCARTGSSTAGRGCAGRACR
jgi:hypothetical protein